MYVDLVVLIALAIVVILFFGKLSSIVFFFAIVEIFLRIMTYLKNNLGLADVSNVINKYLPENTFAIIDKYTSNLGIVNDILHWAFVGIMTLFLFYIIKIFLRKRKI